MRKIGLLVLVLVLFGGMTVSAQELRIYTWSEYMDEEKMPADFEKKFGIKVRLDIYENNEEMVAKLQAGGASQYDIIVPSDYIMPVLINQRLIQPLDLAKIPNLKNLKPLFRETSYDPGNKYSIAYQWGTVGLMYRKDKISDAAAQSWSVLFDADKQAGAFWLIDSVREMMGIAWSTRGMISTVLFPRNSKRPPICW
jgi:spermidine/putrescine transport system substrate-binding protein